MLIKKNILSSSIAIALLGSTMPAWADQSGMIEEVIVQGGIRGSLMQAVDRKRNANGILDAITAEDMGKFPDGNLAESLQRITGVSINRNNGEGSKITVRGMGPEFNLVTLNGRQMPTVGGRSFDFGDMATESVSAVEVYKTSRANLTSGGIGATVNLETTRPLDVPGFKAVVSSKAVMDSSNVKGDDVTPEIAAMFSNTFADDTIGVLVSASYQDRDNREQKAAVNNWIPNVDLTNATVIDNNERADGSTWYAQNAGYNIQDNSRQRLNGQLVLQYAPSDSLKATLDYTTSGVDFESNRRGIGVWFNNGGSATSATINKNGTYTHVEEAGGDYATNVSRAEYSTENESFGLNLEWQASDTLSFELDVHSSSAVSQGEGLGNDAYLIVGNTSGSGFADPTANTANIDLKSAIYPSSGIPIWDLSLIDTNGVAQDEVLGSDMGSLFAGISDKYVENEMTQFQISGNWENADEGALRSIQFGFSRTEQDFKDQNSDSGQLPAGWWGYSAMYWADDLWQRNSTSGLLDGFGNSGDIAVPYYLDASFEDIANGYETIIDTAEYWGQCCYAASWPAELNGKLSAGPIDTDARVNEVITSVYTQLTFEDSFNGMPINATAGLRYEEAKVESKGLEIPVLDMAWVGGNEWSYIRAEESSFSSGGGTTKQFLPSFDISMDISDEVITRFAYSRSLARPSIGALRSTTDFVGNPKVGQRKISVGNPNLKPYLSDNFDLSVEYYYGEGSYVSVGYFKKVVDNFLVNTTTEETYGNLRDAYIGERALAARALIEGAGDQATDPATFEQINVTQGTAVTAQITGADTDPLTTFFVSRDTNGEMANLSGWELAAQHMFADSGWGVLANATIVNGDVDADRDATDSQFALEGMSDSANFSVFYETDVLSARVSYNWRDEFLSGFDQHSSPVFNEEYSQIDANVNYQVNDNLNVFVEALNLTDETQRVYVRYSEQLLDASQYGAIYNIGARYKF